jgi:ABC-type nitrate/sulfonate/bicarbonate transport system permease component
MNRFESEATVRLVLAGIGIVAALSLWWLVSASGIVPPRNLPPPGQVLDRMVSMLSEPYVSATLLGHVGISAFRVISGFLLGCTVGIALAIIMEYVPQLRGTIGFALSLLRPLPPFTLIAVFIVWFGLGEEPKIALIFFGVFARMAVYASTALGAPPYQLLDAARALGTSEWNLLWHVRIPAAIPDIIVGMRVLMAVAWDAVMAAEIIGASQGIGWAIWTAARNLQTDVIFVGMLVIAVLGYLTDSVIVFVGRRFTGDWAARLREE